MTPCNNNQAPTPTKSDDADLGTDTTALAESQESTPQQHQQQRDPPQDEHEQSRHHHHYNQHLHTRDQLLPSESPFQPPRASLRAMEAIDEVLAMLEKDKHLDLFRDMNEQ